MPKNKIMKLRADRILSFSQMQKKTMKGCDISYQIDLDKKSIYGMVVEEQLLMANCALFDQFRVVLNKEYENEAVSDWILPELVIVDFTNIYQKKREISEDSVVETATEDLITNGFIMKYHEKEIHMLPFDKSGNMSRKCRLSFINAERLDSMNERLNLGIDFGKIPLKLSKYYAYRGLYLSTATRIESELLPITPESLIVINDNQERMLYMKNVFVEEGIPDAEDRSKVSFVTRKVEKEEITVPFDGQGLISPIYAERMNQVLGEKNINSFQIRLPFAKGMLHRVDFHAFIREFDSDFEGSTYIIKDAFGDERDLKKAHIIMTKSMFKCFAWIKASCGDKDPMEFYCDAIEKYKHALYVSSTDLPYGKSRMTHLSYQILNTLKLSEEQFQSLVNKQMEYIQNPIAYIELMRGECIDNGDEKGEFYYFPNWQKAVLLNPSFSSLAYIKNQLQNIQASLMTKLVLGKFVVKGQTRYLVRDLPSMLVSLIQNKEKKEELRKTMKIFYYRFFLPQGNPVNNEMELDYNTYCGFFRSPHLSRNEQGLLAPVIEKECPGKTYKQNYDIFNRYFGHLTGIAMFGNESIEPMALGGADFDGDLVNMVTDQDVVEAVKEGVYTKNEKNPLDIYRLDSVPYIKIPSIPAPDETVPERIPYLHIKNTFSNKIGLISNAAIAIGQSEYGNKKNGNNDIKCSHCTILTGLEIDAAKNGVHPDLKMLSENLTTCNYLVFKREFEKLKKHKEYHFNQLQAKKQGKKYVLQLNKTKKTIEYTEEEGTYINKLPIVFMENIPSKLNLPKCEGKNYFCFPETDTNEEDTKLFEEQCNIIFDSYKYYTNLFTFIQKETDNENFSEYSLKKMLQKQYDSTYCDKAMAQDLPYLYQKISSKISTYADFKSLKDKINQERWHLMNRERRKKFLCEILEEDALEEEKWEIVLQPYNHNYKVLWYIVQNLGGELKPEYTELKNKFSNIRSDVEKVPSDIEKQADILLKNHLENKETGILEKLYNICLENLRDMVKRFDLSISKKVEILFNITRAKGQMARFFWECFEWETLEPYIMRGEEHAE